MPSSAKDNTCYIFVNNVFTPKYSSPNIFIKTVLTANDKNVFVSKIKKLELTFNTEFFFLSIIFLSKNSHEVLFV